jgi:hypothetical protein
VLNGERGRDAYREWCATQDVRSLDWPAQRVLALLRNRLDSAGDPVARQIQRVVRVTWLKNQMLLEGAAPAIGALHAEGVPVMLLKGLAVLHHTSWQIQQRPMDDIDVAVPPAHAARAATILREHGYACPHLPPDPASTKIYDQLHALPFTNAAGAEIDLHWHTLHGSLHPEADDDFWRAAQPAQLRGVPCLVPRREDVLLAVLSHGQETNYEHALLWVADAVLLLRATDGGLDWERLERQARRHRLLHPVAEALTMLRELDPELVPARVAWRMRHRPSALLWDTATRSERGRRRGDIATEWLRRTVAPGSPIGPRTLSLALTELWGLERARHVPGHAAWVLSGRRPALARWRGSCRTATGDPLTPPFELGFMSSESGTRYTGAGWWGYADREGSWSRGVEAVIAIPLTAGSRARPLRLDVEAAAQLAAVNQRLTVDVYCDGHRVARWDYRGNEPAPETRSAVIPAGESGIELRFVIRGRISPETARAGADPRPRGLAIRRLRLTAAPS